MDLLSSAAADGTLPVHFPVLEGTNETLAVMPSESALGIVHQAVEELTLVGSVVSDQFALGLLASCELSLVKGSSSFDEQLPLSVDVSVDKLSLVYFAIGPGVLALSMFFAVLEIALIAACIGVVLHSPAIGPVVPPVAVIDCPVGFVGELAESVKRVVLEVSDVVGAIRVDEETLFASSHSSNERSLVENAVLAVEATSAVRSPLAPLPIVEATSHRCQFVKWKFFPLLLGISQVNEALRSLIAFRVSQLASTSGYIAGRRYLMQAQPGRGFCGSFLLRGGVHWHWSFPIR